MTGENLNLRHYRSAFFEYLERENPVELPDKSVENNYNCRYITHCCAPTENETTNNERTTTIEAT